VVDRSWRRLTDFADYYLPKMTATQDRNIREQYTTDLIWRFGDLLKVTLDNNDLESFGIIGREFNLLFQNLEIKGLSKEDSLLLEAFTKKERLLVWFGMGAWILRSYKLKDERRLPGYPDLKLIDIKNIPLFFEQVARNFPNIGQLAEVYMDALSSQYKRPIWRWWLTETLPTKQVNEISTDRWLKYFYAVMGVRLSQTGTPSTSDIPKPFRDLQFLLKDIQEIIGQIKVEQSKWSDLLPKLQEKSLVENSDKTFWDYFISANKLAIDEWNRLNEEEIIASPINDKSIEKFKEDCLKSWQEHSWLVTVLTELGCRIDKVAEADSIYSALDFSFPKEAFIASNDTRFIGLGSDEGSSLGRSVSANLLALIKKAALNVGNSDKESMLNQTSDLIKKMSIPNSNIVVFLSGRFEIERRFLSTTEFFAR
jgi:hypothetical protein